MLMLMLILLVRQTCLRLIFLKNEEQLRRMRVTRDTSMTTYTLRLYDEEKAVLRKDYFSNNPHLTQIFLKNNNISRIDVHAFEGVPGLQTLGIESSGVSALPVGVFASVPALEYLELSHNPIAEVLSTLLNGLTSLKTIRIVGNTVELKIHSRAFADLPSLRTVHLRSSSITSLPQDVFSNSTQLRRIDLEYNHISDIPERIFSGLKNLEILSLGYNKIETLHDSVFFGLTGLRRLHLYGNRLKTLQLASFYPVPNLQVLDLRGNGLIISESEGVYPPSEEYLTSEQDEEFRASDGLYSPLQNLLELRYLDLSNNSISVMCTDWRALPSLRTLDLSSNAIPRLSSEDMHFRSSAKVYLRYNQIQSFDPYVYDGKRSVPVFYLGVNPYHCTCSMLPFLQKRSTKGVASIEGMDKATCSMPIRLITTRLRELTEALLGNCSNTVSVGKAGGQKQGDAEVETDESECQSSSEEALEAVKFLEDYILRHKHASSLPD